MQSWPLERKIMVTQAKIIEFCRKFNDKSYCSFSGGKDSTVLLDIARKVYPEIPAVFIDTGLEYPEIRQFVKTIDNVTILRPEMYFREVIETYGYPLVSKEVSQKIYEARRKPDGVVASRFDPESEHNKKYGKRFSMEKWAWLKDSDIPISDRCCKVMKKKPAKKYERETGRKPIVGTMASESSLRKTTWLKQGCNAFESKRPISAPMSFWTEQDVLAYLKKYDIPYASVYGEIMRDENGKYYTTGCERTGCIWCLYSLHNEKKPYKLEMLHNTHPKLYEYCMKPWKDNGLGLKEVIDYFNENNPGKGRIYY